MERFKHWLTFCVAFFTATLHTSMGQQIGLTSNSWHSLDALTLEDGIDQIASTFILDEEDFSQSLEMALLSSDSLTPLCKEHLHDYAQALNGSINGKDMPYWAIKMFDATGKFPDGILAGNIFVLGSYTSCLDVFAKLSNSTFNGKYALASVPVFGDKGPKALYGMCLPNSCTRSDFLIALKANIPSHLPMHNSTFLTVTQPQTKEDTFQWDNVSVAFVTFVSIWGAVILLATLVDYWYQFCNKDLKSLNTQEVLLQSFSLRKNTTRLLGITLPTKDHLACLDGIRFLSITWVMLGHWFANFEGGFKVNNIFHTFKITEGNFWFQAIDNAFVSVDTFFLLSACLVCYLTMKELDKNKGKINVPLFYIHRYLRLTGVYAFCIFFQASLIGAFSYGPTAQPELLTYGCKNYWYRNFLYINVYTFDSTRPNDLCLGQTWYLDNDMQMFLVSLLIIYPLYKIPKFGVSILGTYIAGFTALVCALTAVKNWPATVGSGGENSGDYFDNNYIKPWCRFQPYLIGILLGYILHCTKSKDVKIQKGLNIFLWLVAFGVGIAVVYGLNIPHIMGIGSSPEPLSKYQNIIYGGVHRLAWAVAVSWMIFACSRGYGGWINDFLSWEAFQPLSKISYIMYLTHLTIQPIISQSFTFTFTYTHSFAVVLFFAELIITILVSGVISVGVELPWLNLEKLAVQWITGGLKAKKTTEGIAKEDPKNITQKETADNEVTKC